MNDQGWKAAALIVIGLAGVNFFYVSDLLLGEQTITLGPKSLIAVGIANLVVLAGLYVAHGCKTK